MKCLYFDCFAGISGDMTLGALMDLGLPRKYLVEELKKLGLSGYSIRVSRALRMGISGKRILVKTGSKKSGHRSYKDIEKIINKSALKSQIKESSRAIFYRIAAAEAQIHNKKVSEIHFHEVGALDSIIDIVGCAIGIDFLGVEQFYASSIPLGHGFVKCRHGTLPVPAPATLSLLKGVPVYASGIQSELVTPTGAAIVSSLVKDFGPLPAMTIIKTGYGAGSRELEAIPNMLRLILGEAEGTFGKDSVRVLEANIDDMSPEWTGYLMEKLFEAGALDVLLIPAYMKKNRPGVLLQVICSEDKRPLLTRLIFQESTTVGVRSFPAERAVLKRRPGKLKTRFGTLQVKIFKDENGEYMVPEFEECRKAAIKRKVPLKAVYEEVMLSARKKENR